MQLQDAIEAALAGDAILFVGAGFSRGATNKANQPLPSGFELSKLLSADLGLSFSDAELPPLEDLAQEYLTQNSPRDLFDLLISRYTATTFTVDQSAIASPAWRRIYTTNYDNVIELCLGAAKRPFRSQTLGDTPTTPPPEHIDVVHLNRFIHRTTVHTIQSDLRLTSLSYASTELSASPWALGFRTDIRFSKAAVFVGYSLADLDITRLISPEPAFTDKCVFIVSTTPSSRDKLRLPHFGTMIPKGIANAAEIRHSSRRIRPTKAPSGLLLVRRAWQAWPCRAANRRR